SERAQALKVAASRSDWDACREALRDLLNGMRRQEVLQLVRNEALGYLPIFERHHPNVVWPRRGLRLGSATFALVKGCVAHSEKRSSRIFRDECFVEPRRERCQSSFERRGLRTTQAPCAHQDFEGKRLVALPHLTARTSLERE